MSSCSLFALRSSVTYSPNLTGGALFLLMLVVQELAVEQSRAKPPTSTVAVTVCPPIPVVSTLMLEVPCPELIVPAETVQLNVGVTFALPPLTFAVNVRASSRFSSAVSGQETVTVGHCSARAGAASGCAEAGGATTDPV